LISRDDLFKKTLASIEWPEITEKLSCFAHSEPGRLACLDMPVSHNHTQADHDLSLTQSLVSYLQLHTSPELTHLVDISSHIRRVQKFGVLSNLEILDILWICHLSTDVLKNFRSRENVEEIKGKAKGLADGIEIGDVFSVERDGKRMAVIKISELRDFVALGLIEGMTEDSLNQLKLDLEEFLEEKEEKKKTDQSNPFTALFGSFKKDKKSTKDKEKEKIKLLKEKGVKPDTYPEKYVRNVAIAGSMDFGFKIYDILKKAYGMASVPYGGEKGEEEGISAPQSFADAAFGFK